MKKLILAISLTSGALSLSGCGGGGSESSVIGSTPAITQNFYAVDYDYQDDKKSYGFDTKKFEVRNGVVAQEEDAIEQYALTKDALYTAGYKFKGTSQANTLTDWTVYELPNIGAKVTFEEISLSNQRVYSTILPGYDAYLSYLLDDRSGIITAILQTRFAKAIDLSQNNPSEKFVSGSSCLRAKKVIPLENSIYFSFDTTDADKMSLTYDQQLLNVQNLKNLETVDNKVDIQTGQWANKYRWIKVKTDYKATPSLNMEFAFVEFNGVLYRAEVENSQTIDTTVYLAQAKEALKTASLDQQAELKRVIATFEQGCFLYNETAAKQIANYIR